MSCLNRKFLQWRSSIPPISTKRINTFQLKKNLKIPKGQSESVYQKVTDNTMAKRKRTKEKRRSTKHTNKTTYRVTRIPLKIEGDLRCSRRLGSTCSTSDTIYDVPMSGPRLGHVKYVAVLNQLLVPHPS